MKSTAVRQEESVKWSAKPKFAPSMSWMALGFLWLIFAMNATSREIMFRVMPAIVDDYQLSADVVGEMVSLIMVSTGILSIFGASWSDKEDLDGQENIVGSGLHWVTPHFLF